MVRMHAGALRQAIQFERDVITRASGAESSVPTVFASTHAKAEALGGTEAWRAQQIAAGVNWQFTVRYEWRGQIKSSDRVIWRGDSYEIKAVIPDELGRRSLALLCRSINPI